MGSKGASREVAKGVQPETASQRLGLSAAGAGGQTPQVTSTRFCSLDWTSSGPKSNLEGRLVRGGRSFADVALYKIATVLPDSLKGSMKIISPLALPKIAERPDKCFYTPRNHRRLSYLLLLNVAIVLASIAVIPTVMSLVYGERYVASVFYAQILMLSLVLAIPNAVLRTALRARKKVEKIYQLSLLYGVLRIGTLLVFVPLWGIGGIVLSRIVSRVGAGICRWYVVAKNV